MHSAGAVMSGKRDTFALKAKWAESVLEVLFNITFKLGSVYSKCILKCRPRHACF